MSGDSGAAVVYAVPEENAPGLPFHSVPWTDSSQPW